MNPTIPDAALQHHIAVLGKTGSGKTSSAKLLVERLVPTGARVCVLDPIKSDWWGITSSADGKKPGLPFHILGGPHGHVPLHSGAGKAIGELVGSGKLPLSIIDMADFEAGGLQRFFVDFAPALLRAMRGVLYLVKEEAHEFAPKERAGFGQENMAIHFAKKLATAGRSKGIRLIVATQATQLLHNRVLGSCETMIVHRFTAPADQEPVVKWLKANTTKAEVSEVEGSLSRLATGEAWIVSGEAQIFKRVQFPRIATYDNSATPTDDAHQHEVKTAPVDAEGLRAIIGDAVKDAEANDPRLLRAEISRLKAELARRATEKVLAVDHDAVRSAEVTGRMAGRDDVLNKVVLVHPHMTALSHALQAAQHALSQVHEQKPVAPVGQVYPRRMPVGIQKPPTPRPVTTSTGNGALPKVERAFLTVLAQQGRTLTRNQVAIFAGYSAASRHVDNTLAALRSKNYVIGGSAIEISDEGRKALGAYDPLPTGAELQTYWERELDKAASAFLRVICGAYPGTLTRDEVAERAGYSPQSRHVDNTLAQLRSRDLITGSGKAICASENLFD